MREPLHKWFAQSVEFGVSHLTINLPALISIAVVVGGSFALSTLSVEAKTSPNSSRRARNYLVPPPPPYIPLMVPSAMGMMNAQAVAAYANDAVLEQPVNHYSKYIYTRNQGDMPQVAQPNPYLGYNRGVETKILQDIDYFDSEISSHEKEIGKLLNL